MGNRIYSDWWQPVLAVTTVNSQHPLITPMGNPLPYGEACEQLGMLILDGRKVLTAPPAHCSLITYSLKRLTIAEHTAYMHAVTKGTFVRTELHGIPDPDNDKE